MNRLLQKNYLRSCRKKLGLTQRHLAFVLGHQTGCRVSALEAGRSVPSLRSIIAFRILFSRSIDELWPQWVNDVESDVDSRIERLIDRLQKTQTNSSRRNLRAEFTLRQLESILQELPEE